MDVDAPVESAEKGASSVEMKSETLAGKLRRKSSAYTSRRRRRWIRTKEEAARQAAAEIQPACMTTPTHQEDAAGGAFHHRNKVDILDEKHGGQPENWHLLDDFMSQVVATHKTEMVADSPPLQRTQSASGITENQHAHNLFDKSQDDTKVWNSTPNA
ncbi:hypothetical protein ZWY2020_022371 [Hordeum vulgare]|nr:hypothetical protein ZWY2020_022371 [Hordeum vulgare]